MHVNSSVVLFVNFLLFCSMLSGPVGAESFSTDTINPVSVASSFMEEIVAQVDESLVRMYHENLMSFGPRYTGSINCTLAGQYLYECFEEMNLSVAFHEWEYDGFHSRNVVATLEGTDPDRHGYYVVSAHYDCTPGSLGADDDGSGVAAVLSIAQIMSQYQFNNTVRFILFSGEEVGTYGSFSYACDCYQNGDDVLGVINLDMIGYANTTKGGRLIRFHSPKRSEWIAEWASEVSMRYSDLLHMGVELRPNYIGADHQGFVQFGYDGVWIAHHDGYPWGNTPQDTPDHLNWTYQIKATRFLLAFVVDLARTSIPIQVHLRTPYEGSLSLFDRSVWYLDGGKPWYLELRGVTLLIGGATALCEVFSKDPVEQVIFCIDDDFLRGDSQPPYEWKIQGKFFPLIGRHTLRVFAYTTTGEMATDEMDIFIVTLSCQYGRF